MRVLIIRNAYQQDVGGAEQYALNLAVALKIAGHQPLLVTKVKKIHEKALKAQIESISGPWHNTQKWDRWYYLRYPVFTIWYMSIILFRRINAVHPQGRDDFIFATKAAHLLRKPVVWTDHADLKYALDDIKHHNPRMRRWLIKASVQAKAIICASENEKHEIQTVAPEIKNLKTIHNGVFPADGITPVIKTNKFIIGTNARLVESKGIAELIESFANIDRLDVDLWLLGGTSGNQQKYEDLCRSLKIFDRVKIFNYVERPSDVVASMDVFVHASYHEAFSLAIIEAAMLARPIVATRVGGTPEIIDNNCGVLIEPKNAEAISKPVIRLLNSEQLRDRLGKAAQLKAKRYFNIQKIVENKIIPLYNELNEND